VDFVAIDTRLGSDRVCVDLARDLRVPRAHAAGLLALVYAGMANHAPTGDLSCILDEQIEEWAYWHGKPGRLAPVIRRYLCDAQGLVRAWDRWNGAMIRKAKQDRERKRAARHGARQSTDSPRNVHGQSTDSPRNGAGTVPDLTVPDLTTTTNYGDSASPTARGAASGQGVSFRDEKGPPAAEEPVIANNWPARVADRWTAQVGLIEPGRVGKQLGPMIRTFGEAVVVRAVDSFATHRRLAVQAGTEKPDGWPQFVRDFTDYVPKTVLAAMQARQDGPAKAPKRAQDATEAA
jgi:hypothetical protein